MGKYKKYAKSAQSNVQSNENASNELPNGTNNNDYNIINKYILLYKAKLLFRKSEVCNKFFSDEFIRYSNIFKFFI